MRNRVVGRQQRKMPRQLQSVVALASVCKFYPELPMRFNTLRARYIGSYANKYFTRYMPAQQYVVFGSYSIVPVTYVKSSLFA